MAEVGIIGGSGVYHILENPEIMSVETPYGQVRLRRGKIGDTVVYFIPRHGEKHNIPPHKINYRANIYAFYKIGIDRILSTSAVGSLHPQLKPGDIIIIDQFIDMTKNRAFTFYDGRDEAVYHVDMTEPYCKEMREILYDEAKKMGYRVAMGGTYACMEGPRYETPAEISMLKHVGADVVGMTNIPEVVLAREKCMCYATVGLVTNWAAGISGNVLTTTEVKEIMQRHFIKIKKIFSAAIPKIARERSCECPQALDNSKM